MVLNTFKFCNVKKRLFKKSTFDGIEIPETYLSRNQLSAE